MIERVFLGALSLMLVLSVTGCNESDVASPVPFKKDKVDSNSTDTATSTAWLSDLSLSAGAISPSFKYSTLSYSLSVPYGKTTTTVTPTTAFALSTVTVNGTELRSGKSSEMISLDPGVNSISVTVTPISGETKTYAVVVSRNKEAAETDIVGVWRTSIASGATLIKVTMVIGADHTMLISERMPTSNPNIIGEAISKEYWTWTLVDGQVKSTKTTCYYGDPPNQIDQVSACRAPLTKIWVIDLSGNTWTIIENGQPIVFLKD